MIKVDKQLHFLVSAFIVFAIYAFIPNLLVAGIIALMVGLLKEVYDEYTYGGWDWYDMLADVIGILVSSAVISLGWLVCR